MINVLKGTASFIHGRIPSLSIRRSNGKWLSTAPRNDPTRLLHDSPEDNLCSFFVSQRDQRQPTTGICDYALVSALKSCSSLLAIFQGEQLHSLALKSGLDSNIFIYNSFINLYVKCGRIESARSMFDSSNRLDFASCNIMLGGYVKSGRLEDAVRLFEIMPARDCVSFTTMIMGFAQNYLFVDALGAFQDMQAAGVAPNEVTLASVISAYSQLGGLVHGFMIHGLAVKLGLQSFNLVSTNLIHMYSACLNLADAKVIFDDNPERNIVTWNVMLNGYSKAGLIDSARDLFDRMPVKDLVSWGTIIDGYVRAEKLSEAILMYIDMLQAGFGPNEVMIVDLVSACGRSAAFDDGQQFHATMVKTGLDCHEFVQATIIHFYSACHKINLACMQFESGSKSNISSWNALIAGFVKNGMVDSARNLFNVMPHRDVVSWSSMIAGYAQSGQSDLTLQLFHEMLASGIQPNEITMVSILSAIATSGTLKQGRWVLDYIHHNSIPLNDNLSAGLIDMYAKCGSIDGGLQVFHQICDKVSSVSPWNAIICGLAMHGHADMALKLFTDLQRTRIKPNFITFIGVLSACCHAGLVDVAEGYFDCMKKVYNVDPNIKHYGCMIDLLGRAGRLEEAEQLIGTMPMKADVVIWGTLLAACRTHGNMEIGEKAAENLARLEPTHGAGRVLLSNLYANAGRWHDAFLVRRAIQSQGLKKLPGCSGVV
ncbi:pentatricopeptide repeat-containing protein At5g19020, mitochondrial [Telopea speciosissima]|uniref:pentatricopeptide repeat-containing protein At5g19020, mitochondrial n=1 Tax=Telopea speciosissima TaxID=54955 RepID=UPI001CC52D08|nr:pentatricopeptide repeat-containing protein At5g19020, mitochondrial [Telopea speciosissima]